MKFYSLLFFCVLNFLSERAHAQEQFEMKEGDTTYVMQKYFVCFLSKGDQGGYDSLESLEIQKQHLTHLNKLDEEGKISIAGPFGDSGDLRGIVIFNVATLEEAIELESEDPAVKAGLLKMEVRPWWAAKGSVLK